MTFSVVKGRPGTFAGGHNISGLPITVHHVEAECVVWCTTYTGETPFPVPLDEVELYDHKCGWGF